MRKLLGTVVVVAVLAAGSADAADAASGFGASLRLGYGIPMGSVSGNAGADLSRFFSGQLPLQVDLGYRFNPYVSAAVFGQYAFNFISSDLGCTGTVSCSGHDIRTGLELFIHPVPGAGRIDPWFGVGAGYEWATLSASGPGGSGDLTVRGFEFVNLQLGADYLVAPGFGIGPFVQLTLGQFSTGEVSGGNTGGFAGGDITNKSIHEWLQFGIRGSYNL